MTCIVGVVDNGRVYIGGDSVGVDGCLGLTVRSDRKVFRNGPFVFGFTTSFRMGQILEYNFVPPTIPDKAEDIFRYMCSSFINEARKSMKDCGYAEVERNVESGGTFLVGVGGRLFKIGSDFQVGESSDGFDACGCGSDLALGSMWASRGEVDCRVRILGALEAAERFSAGVRRPFVVLGV